ncbi:MAG TPA: HAMP domain-containing sensor histidine kinase [Candidatus Sulfotelmatobacter sp.]|nr:HAMP domain-containing sensor histidine kinase [Candidatus Sulfotelmatobacter sp.]
MIGPLRMSGSQLLRAGLFVGASLLAAAVFIFTNQALRRLTHEVETTSRVLARFCAQASIPATRDPELQRIFSEVLSGIEFPIVITDTLGMPRAWREIDVDPALVPAASIDSLEDNLPIAQPIRDRIERVRAQVVVLDRLNTPIAMTQPGTGARLGAVHYGAPPVLERLRLMPVISVVGVMVLLALGYWGLAGIREADRRIIWVGMAKETAHQLGTPLSSLMGWVELLRANLESGGGERVTLARAETEETLGEMDRDIERLSRVAQRFSHVGSSPNLQLQDPTPVVREAVAYMRRRIPQAAGEVEIVERYEEVPPINLSRELLEWAVENLLSNAIDALDKRPARITVTVERRSQTEAVEIVIADNGRGMSLAEQRRAFEPGYTTKRRGWGLGLALARRVVEEYHGGRLAIRHSAPHQGTVIVASFPT